MSVKVSRISRMAAILIIAIGVFSLMVGVAANYIEETVSGIGITVLGVFLYWLLYRFTRRVEREIADEDQA